MVYSILVMFPSPDSGSVADLDVKLSGVATCCLVSRLQPNYPSHFLPGGDTGSGPQLRDTGPMVTTSHRGGFDVAAYIWRAPGPRPQSSAAPQPVNIRTVTMDCVMTNLSQYEPLVTSASDSGSLSSEDVERLRSLLPPELQQSGKLSHLEIIMEAISYIKMLQNQLGGHSL